MTEAVVQRVQALDAELPVYDVHPMEQRLSDALARRRFSMVLLGGFAAFAAIPAAIGIYGVTAYWVSQRTHEIGLRMALGAQPGSILRLVTGRASRLVAVGLAVGLAGAGALTHLMSSLLYGTSATDGWTFAALSLLLGGVALVAGYLSGRRGSTRWSRSGMNETSGDRPPLAPNGRSHKHSRSGPDASPQAARPERRKRRSM